jgi:hypothetical protein
MRLYYVLKEHNIHITVPVLTQQTVQDQSHQNLTVVILNFRLC